MTKPYLIAPSILSADFLSLGDQIAQAQSGGADWLHIDVMDGHFVPNITMGPLIVETCRRATDLPLDVHLMIEEPERYIREFANAGANSLSVHVETCPHLHRTIQQIREAGCNTGVVINPGTPVSMISPVLHLVDLVLVMSVNPGYSGQEFLPEVLPKLSEIRASLDRVNPNAYVQIDGGISANTLPMAFDAGANVFVAATAIFKYQNGITEGIRVLREKISQKEKLRG